MFMYMIIIIILDCIGLGCGQGDFRFVFVALHRLDASGSGMRNYGYVHLAWSIRKWGCLFTVEWWRVSSDIRATTVVEAHNEWIRVMELSATP